MRLPLEDNISEEYLIKYIDRTYEDLNYILNSFQEIIINFNMHFLEEKFHKLKKVWLDVFVNCKTDRYKLESFYKLYITSMSFH